MSLNEFVLAFMGVIIGLGVSDMLQSFHRLLRAASRVRWDWLALAYAGLMLYSLIVFWWWQFGYPHATTLTIAEFTPWFVFLVISFLMVASALPDDVPPEGVDLRAFYMASRRYRWGLVLASLIVSSGLSVHFSVANGRYGELWWFALPLVNIALACWAMRSERVWVQALTIGSLFGVTSYFNLLRPIGG